MSPIDFLPALSSALTLFSLYLYRFRKRPGVAIWCLFAGAFLLRWWMASIDPFLHDWDERFHALVASNMLQEPFRPMLITHPNPGYDYKLWCCNHIWLHKPPLFLWQMAMSMRLFGVDLWSMRLPSVCMGALLVFPIFRMGTLMRQADIGFYGAVLYTFAYNQLEMISGAEGMDHNDVAFSFYVTLSMWAWFEYVRSGETIRWAVWVGIFAGAAVLCKWLAGMLVYAVWAIDWLFVSHASRIRRLRPMVGSVGVAMVLFLPWQLYVFWKFPVEAAYEQAYNLRHIFEVVERHGGDWSYYFEPDHIQYGNGGWMIALAGLILVLRMPLESRLRNALLLSVMFVYCFFSFIAATKMPNFVYFIAPMVFLLSGGAMACLDRRFHPDGQTNIGSMFFIVLLLIGCFLTLAPDRIATRHFNLDPKERAVRVRKVNNTRIYRQLDSWTPEGCTVYNCSGELEAMFFSSRIVYGMAPTYADFKTRKQNGACMAIFDDPDDLGVPGFILEDSAGVIFLKEKLIRDK